MRDRRLLRILLLPSLAAVLGATALAGSADSAPSTKGPRTVIVGFKPNVSLAGQADALSDAGVKRMRRYPQIRSSLVAVGAQSTAGAVRDLEQRPASRLRGAELHRPRGHDPQRPVPAAALGPEQHGADGELDDRHARRGHRRARGLVGLDRQPRRHRRGHRHRRRRHASGSRAEHLGQPGRGLRGLPHERRRRRRERLRRRLARLGLRERRQQPDRRQRPRDARRRERSPRPETTGSASRA